MRKSLIALALSLPLAVAAADGKAVSDRVKIDADRRIRVEMDKGSLTVTPSTTGYITYLVKFVPDETRPMFRFFGGVGPSPRDYDESSASFDALKGVLTIHTGSHLDAVVTIEVPVKQPLGLQLTTGEAKIGPVTGKLDAFIKDGILKYDASALAPGVCVKATINDGIVENNRDFKCESAGAVLHGHTGIISVK